MDLEAEFNLLTCNTQCKTIIEARERRRNKTSNGKEILKARGLTTLDRVVEKEVGGGRLKEPRIRKGYLCNARLG